MFPHLTGWKAQEQNAKGQLTISSMFLLLPGFWAVSRRMYAFATLLHAIHISFTLVLLRHTKFQTEAAAMFDTTFLCCAFITCLIAMAISAESQYNSWLLSKGPKALKIIQPLSLPGFISMNLLCLLLASILGFSIDALIGWTIAQSGILN